MDFFFLRNRNLLSSRAMVIVLLIFLGLDVHDVQSLQDTEDAEKFQEKGEVLFPKMQEAIQFLPTMADKLDDVRMEGKVLAY